MSPLEAFGALGLDVGASPKAVRVAFIIMAKTAHPDVGGDPETFNYLKTARDIADKDAMAARCLVCNGRGKKAVTHGFSALVVACGDCKGTGKRYQKGD